MFILQFFDVPICTDPVTFMTILFFHCSENKRMQGTEKKDLCKSTMSGNVFQLFNDIIMPHNSVSVFGTFSRNKQRKSFH